MESSPAGRRRLVDSPKTERVNDVKRGGLLWKEARPLSTSPATSQEAVSGKGRLHLTCSRRPESRDDPAIDEPENGGRSCNDVSSAVDEFFAGNSRPSPRKGTCGEAGEVASDASRSEWRLPDDPLS